MSAFTTISRESLEGFDLVLSVAPEAEPLAAFFDAADVPLIQADIEAGRLKYFVARVEAFRDGTLIGRPIFCEAQLLASFSEFLATAEYDQMANHVLDVAHRLMRRAA